MIISERIFEIMKEQKISQRELARRTGMTASTISDWNTKKTNPSADKLLVISQALGVSVEDLLVDSERYEEKKFEEIDIKKIGDNEILSEYHNLSKSQKQRLIKYLRRLSNMKNE